jgi:hypothetical protein
MFSTLILLNMGLSSKGLEEGLQLLTLGGCIGTGLFVGSGQSLSTDLQSQAWGLQSVSLFTP